MATAKEVALAGGRDGFADAWAAASVAPGWFSETDASIFWSVIRDCTAVQIVEIGSYQGRSTIFLGTALKHFGRAGASLTAIDPHTGDRQHMEKLGVSAAPSLDMFRLHVGSANIDDILDVRVMTSSEAAQGWEAPIDLLFVDGWHSHDAVLEDGRNFASYLSHSGIVCFDDYAKHPEIQTATATVCEELGLQFYGTVNDQAWAGRAAPPNGLAAAIKVGRARSGLARGRRKK